jgi:hypothetical protein
MAHAQTTLDAYEWRRTRGLFNGKRYDENWWFRAEDVAQLVISFRQAQVVNSKGKKIPRLSNIKMVYNTFVQDNSVIRQATEQISASASATSTCVVR